MSKASASSKPRGPRTVYGEIMKSYTVRMTQEQNRKFDELGGPRWLRGTIDSEYERAIECSEPSHKD